MKTYRLTSPGPSSRLDYQGALNPGQLEAVMAGDGAHLVVAGAGSGKTRTLTYRVSRLIERGVPAASIALCTFTNKAARQMLSRVEQLIGAEVRRVWGGTFHHLANRLLRELCQPLGFSDSYSILDQEDARDLLAACLADMSDRAGWKLGPSPAVLEGLIGLAVNTLTPLEELILQRQPALVDRLDEISRVARAYRERKRAMNAMDFDDLLYYLYRLLGDQPEQSARIAERFVQVLVDEYQDTTPLQCELVDRLAAVHGNLTVVGDDAQSIYGFRGADPDNILTFTERWPNASLHKLELNYRSTPQILALTNASIANNQRQVPKRLEATLADGDPPAVVPVTDAQMEAAFVAQRIDELADEGQGLDEMAVLYRAHHHSMELQVELTRREIPYIVRSGVRFFEQAHIKDVLAHLRLVLNPRDELSWLRVLRLQPGIGRTGAARIWDRLGRAADPLAEALAKVEVSELPSRNRDGWNRLRTLLQKLDAPEVRQQAPLAIETVLEGGYGEMLPSLYTNPQSRYEDVTQLARYAVRFADPHAFLTELNLLASFASETVLQPGRNEEQLTLSTVHQAKGLEWKAVFVLALNQNAFPHPRAIQEPQGLEEERRLFYVACTRAKEQLYLLSRQVEDRPRQRRLLLKPSRFLEEIAGRDLFERWIVE